MSSLFTVSVLRLRGCTVRLDLAFKFRVCLTPESRFFYLIRLFSEMCVCRGGQEAGNSLGLEGGNKSGDWRLLGRGTWGPRAGSGSEYSSSGGESCGHSTVLVSRRACFTAPPGSVAEELMPGR